MSNRSTIETMADRRKKLNLQGRAQVGLEPRAPAMYIAADLDRLQSAALSLSGHIDETDEDELYLFNALSEQIDRLIYALETKREVKT